MKKGDLALIIGGPWVQMIGNIVQLIRPCSTRYGRCVQAEKHTFYMTADGPVWLVRHVRGKSLLAGTQGREPTIFLKRRPYCAVHLRLLTDQDCVFDTTVSCAEKDFSIQQEHVLLNS